MKNKNNIGLIILGFGKIGQALTRQISAMTAEYHYKIVGLADSQSFVTCEEGFSPNQLASMIALKSQGRSLRDGETVHPLGKIATPLTPHTILVDTSASPDTLPFLQQAMQFNAGIVLANKYPLCRPWPEVQNLFGYPLLRYEATVGAGLPVISTIKYLLDTGDELQSIIGCLSGTLGYLCSQLEDGVPYSQAIRAAHALGYTEPDPRQDLGGLDVARKAIILARTAGMHSELAEMAIQPLFSHDFETVSVENFLSYASKDNNHYANLVKQAQAEYKTPRYTARISPNDLHVGLSFVEKTSSLGSLQGTENYIALQTKRYSPSPLVITGPGAGVEVTAAGVFGDIIQLGKEMIERE